MRRSKFFITKAQAINLSLLAIVLLVVLPVTLDGFRLNLVGKYLSYAFVAVGLVLCWGYGGILSLGQGVFFGIGGYVMAAFLKLEVSTPELTKSQTTPGIPDFMDWNQLTALPWFWQPFHSLTFTIVVLFVIPSLIAWLIGFAMFKRRVGGVYFAIITQSLAAILTTLIIGQQPYVNGVNGITNLKTLKGMTITSEGAKEVLYFVTVALLLLVLVVGTYVTHSKAGRLLLAMRDKEDRVRFSGYDVANFKVFVFILAAIFAAIGGAMFTLQVGFIAPSIIGIVPSIEMVIFAAVGGRYSLVGAVYGALLVNGAKTYLSEAYPEFWLYFLGALFMAVVLAFPEGIAGVFQKLSTKFDLRAFRERRKAWATARGPSAGSGGPTGTSVEAAP